MIGDYMDFDRIWPWIDIKTKTPRNKDRVEFKIEVVCQGWFVINEQGDKTFFADERLQPISTVSHWRNRFNGESYEKAKERMNTIRNLKAYAEKFKSDPEKYAEAMEKIQKRIDKQFSFSEKRNKNKFKNMEKFKKIN